MKTRNPVTEVNVSEIMTTHVEVVSPTDSIKDAVSLMVDSKLTTIPVVNGDAKCIGILSRSDLTEMFLQEDSELSRAVDTDRLALKWLKDSLDTSDVRQVKELMTYDVVTIRADQSLSVACKEMTKQRVHHLPVVNDREIVVGIVSAFDVVKAVAEA